MNDALLGADELAALFRDYHACAGIDAILVKTGPAAVANPAKPTLEQAEELLRSRTVRAVQIRYQFDGCGWTDTLMTQPNGVRLVRIRHNTSDHPTES